MSPLARSRTAVATIFAVCGCLYANWTSRLPRLQTLYDIDNGQTGFALTALAVGAVLGMPVAGYLIVRNGSRRITLAAAFFFIAALPLMAYMPGYYGLLLVMPLLGIGTGTMDVAMNAQAVAVEEKWGSPITSSFHAAFSIGMFGGAGVAAAMIWAGFDVGPHLVLVSGAMAVVVFLCIPHLIMDEPAGAETGGSSRPYFGSGILLLGMASLCCMIGEGSMADWTPLYMTRVTGAAESLAPIGQAAFSGAMVTGRIFGDWIRHRLGSALVIRGGALLAMAGLVLVIFYPLPAAAIAGFAMVGLGLSNIVPIVFSTASKVPGLAPGVGISSVSFLGYSGFLVGPPVIGFVADWQNNSQWLPGVEGLRLGLGFVLGLMVVLLGLSFWVRRT